MIKVIQTLPYLINGVLQKKSRYTRGRYKRRGANLVQSKSESSLGGTESHAGMLFQPMPKLELSILLLTEIFFVASCV